MLDCTKCRLSKCRTQVVPGIGPMGGLMVIAEAPGRQEDKIGLPLVGISGEILAQALVRSKVYTTNIVKCRPPGNRDPMVDEVAFCSQWLMQEIENVSPTKFLILGRVAALALSLITKEESLSVVRGKELLLFDRPAVVTYHPAYVARNRGAFKVFKEDIESCLGIIE